MQKAYKTAFKRSLLIGLLIGNQLILSLRYWNSYWFWISFRSALVWGIIGFIIRNLFRLIIKLFTLHYDINCLSD
jgi:hypothetical protein